MGEGLNWVLYEFGRNKTEFLDERLSKVHVDNELDVYKIEVRNV